MKSMLKDAGILFAITLVAGLLLGCVYQITKEPIARQEALAQENACREVFSDAESFEAVTDFTEEELKQVPGEFTPSPFVKKITGVDNVCERSAVLASGNGRLLQRKTGENGVTTAVAAREWRIHFE